MPTDADIGNMALSRLGTRATIADLTENSTEARVLNTWYATVRDDLLGQIDWNFARVRQALAASGTPPARWSYSYAYPSDALKVWQIDLGTTIWYAGEPMALFEIASDGTNRLLYTNESTVTAVFSQRVTDPNRFTAAFTLAFADQLAARVAYPITQKADLASALQRVARDGLEQAMCDAANEQVTNDRDRNAESITVRGYDYTFDDYRRPV
jgi:hypothetical protein